MAQQQGFPAVGTIRTVNGAVYVSDGEQFVPKSTENAVATIQQVAPQAPERSYGDMARSMRDTAAEFLPAVGGVLGSAGGPPGTLTGQSLGQAARELIQRGGQVPAAIADIYRNLRSGDQSVAQATIRGYQRGADEGKINLVPGGREAQSAVTAFREGKPYTAAADTLGALLNVITTGASGPIRKAFMAAPPRATIGTLLGLTGSKLGGMAGGAVADEVGMTPDQRVLAEAVGSTAGFPMLASLAHPKVPVIARAVAESPVAQGLVAGGAALARGADPFTALGAAAAPSAAKVLLKKYSDRTAAQREGIASKERMQERGIASKERIQERGITAKREDIANSLASDAALLAEARAETAKNLSAKQQGDLFKLDQAHKNRLERDVLQAGTATQQNALKRSQKVGDLLESREYAGLLAEDKAIAKALESELQDELRTSRDGTTAQNRQEAFDRADAIRAQQAKLASEKETRTRNNALSDAARRNDRKAEITAAHTAAQLSKTHLSNVESILKAQTPDALNTAKQMADYHLELAENIDPDFRAALQGKIDQVFETQSATMAERLAEQNALIQGLESKGVRATRSSSAQDASGNRQRVTEAFSERAPVEEPVPQQGAPASRPAAEPKGSAPKTKPSDKVTPDNVLEKLRDQAEVEQPSWERNQLRDVGSDAQQLSRDLVVTPEGAQTLDNMLNRLRLSASESGVINAATGSEVNMGESPTGERAYDARRIQGRKGR